MRIRENRFDGVFFNAAGGGAPAAGAPAAGAPAAPAAGAPAAGAGGGDPGATAPGAGAPAAPAGGQAPAAAAAYRPSGLPDHFAGKDDKETIDKLYTAVNGFRQQQGDRGSVPAAPDKYTFEPSEALKPYVADFDKDPIYAKTREIFHKAGLTDKQFQGVVGPWLESLIDGGLVAPPVDAKAQLLALAPASAANLDPAGKEAAAAKRVRDNIAWCDVAKEQNTIPGAEFLAAALASDPRAHEHVEWLRGMNAEPRPALDGKGGQGGVTEAELQARIVDPRNDPRSGKFERAFAEETDRLSKLAYPG